MQQELVSNIPEWSVSELSGALKRTLEDQFGHVRLRGEISGYRGPHGSGHVYFSIKDASAKIDAVIWKGVFSRVKFRPEDGMEVVATGKITTFAGKSSYQIIVETLEPAGVGALLQQLEQRKQRLAAEGLFADARKQLIPFLPRTIGVITSPTGAVIRDILHRLTERFPCHVLVWPVRVQGEGSGEEITAAISGFNALPENGAIPRPDLLIVARGGGSLEDLWSFNDESVVRAAAESLIPLISAVGHETDWTLIDYAADQRAPTPTAAAEMAVPVRSELLATLGDIGRRQFGALRRLHERLVSELRLTARALPSGADLVSTARQRCDIATAKLHRGMERSVEYHRGRITQQARRLAKLSPDVRMAGFRAQLTGLGKRLSAARGASLRMEQRLIVQARAGLADVLKRRDRAFDVINNRRHARLETMGQLLVSLSYQGVLARGYALVMDINGKPVRQAVGVKPGDRLDIRFHDGGVTVTADGDRADKPSSTGLKRKAADQKSLF